MSALRRFNAWMTVVHTVQAILILVISADFSLPVTSSFVRFDADVGRLVPAPDTMFMLRIGPVVAAFLLLSAIAHLIVAGPAGRWYDATIARGINPARWIEYSLSASLMIVVVAMLVGIYDVASLILIFSVNAAMILFGWLMEVMNEHGTRARWLPFWFGSLMGAMPWVAIAIYLGGSGGPEGGPPGFVYGIFGSIFVFFNLFAVVMVLQYRARGRWADYARGERAYVWLSLFAKSALAWQVFAGTLRPV